MAIPGGEPHDLVLDRWTVARPSSGDMAAVDRRPMKIGPNDRVCGRGGPSDAAFHLRVDDALGEWAEWLRHGVAGVGIEAVPVNRQAVQPRWRAGLQSAEGEFQPLQRARQSYRGRLPYPAGRTLLIANVDQAAQKGSGGQHRCAAMDRRSVGAQNAGQTTIASNLEVLDRTCPYRQPRCLGQHPLDRPTVQRPISLGARSTHRRPFAAVQQFEMDARRVRCAAHQTIQRIDLAHQVPLANSANRRIA